MHEYLGMAQKLMGGMSKYILNNRVDDQKVGGKENKNLKDLKNLEMMRRGQSKLQEFDVVI